MFVIYKIPTNNPFGINKQIVGFCTSEMLAKEVIIEKMIDELNLPNLEDMEEGEEITMQYNYTFWYEKAEIIE